ncbi:MAG: hypothetical protein FD180_2476 [Planctomycetota bacterium]|nr:MAG: hypothetical protein FD180_2476 [Planctomycetota bacterium]
MRRFEHAVIALLLAALAALSYVHFLSRIPAVNTPAAGTRSEALPPSVSPPVSGRQPADAAHDGANPASPRQESDDERRAREYAGTRLKMAELEESQQFDRLVDLAKSHLAAGGADALFWALFPKQEGSGNDEDLRRLVAEYAKETDPARLWALAQRIRFHLTDPRGRIWTVDSDAFREFEKWASAEGDPYKRGFALGSAGATGWGDESAVTRGRLLNDPDERIRATAAVLLPAPNGVSADEARPVADRYRELLESRDENVRASAAGSFGPWAFREEDVEALVRAAGSDSSDAVRANATRALAANGSDKAKQALADLVKDLSQPQVVRDAARQGLKGAGVVPEGLEEIKVIRSGGK